MLGAAVDYLHNASVPFRLTSHPIDEETRISALPLPGGALLVDVGIFRVDQRAILVAVPARENVDLAALSAAVGGGDAEPATPDDLPEELRESEQVLPPFGQLFGLPLVVDERVARASSIVFRAFGESDCFELSYDDFASLEQPHVAAVCAPLELDREPAIAWAPVKRAASASWPTPRGHLRATGRRRSRAATA
jgi:Ala-tRNA(Pro) deacylase